MVDCEEYPPYLESVKILATTGRDIRERIELRHSSDIVKIVPKELSTEARPGAVLSEDDIRRKCEHQ